MVQERVVIVCQRSAVEIITVGWNCSVPGDRGEARAELGNWGVGAETYPVQGDVGNLETQDDDPKESQDECLVSIHNVLWPNKGNWHLWVQLAGVSVKPVHQRRRRVTTQPGSQPSDGRVPESVLPCGVPKGEADRAQGQASKGFLSG